VQASLKRLFVVAACVVSASAAAQDFPTKTVTLVVPNPPGGSIDVMARVFADGLQKLWGGKPVIVEYKPGAGTMIGMDFVAKSEPDGHTIGMVVTPMVILPALRKMPYDTLKDLAPVTMTGTSSIMIAASPKLPTGNLREVIELAKKNPGKLTYASPGAGSSMHLAGELLKQEAGIDMLHVPFKGGGPAMVDVIGGHTKLLFSSLVQTTPHLKSGKLKALGTGGKTRSSVLPDVPTIAEAGVPGYEATNWWGIVAPAGTPQPIIAKLHKEIAAVQESPEVKQQFARQGAAILQMSTPEFTAFIQTEMTKWGRVVKEGKLKKE